MQFLIKGKVIKGDGYGRKIGYPTLNLDRRNFLKLKDKPKFGVYAGEVVLENKKYKSGIIIGPLDKKGLPKLEAHMIEFKGNAYGRSVVVEIEKFIRNFKKFKTEEDLIKQIQKDLKKCLQG